LNSRLVKEPTSSSQLFYLQWKWCRFCKRLITEHGVLLHTNFNFYADKRDLKLSFVLQRQCFRGQRRLSLYNHDKWHSIYYIYNWKNNELYRHVTWRRKREKVIVVTGGLGKAMIRSTHGIGRKVAITSRDLDKLKIQLQNLSLKQVVLVCHYNVTFVTMMKSKICYKPFWNLWKSRCTVEQCCRKFHFAQKDFRQMHLIP
jgi:hypothetical protein